MSWNTYEGEMRVEGLKGSIDAKVWHRGKDVRFTLRDEHTSLYFPMAEETLEVMRDFLAGNYKRFTYSAHGASTFNRTEFEKGRTLITCTHSRNGERSKSQIILSSRDLGALVSHIDIALKQDSVEERRVARTVNRSDDIATVFEHYNP